jgi:cytosine permease
MTADFTRWSKNGREGLLAAITAFPFGKFIAEVVGAIIVATGAIQSPATSGGDFMPILSGQGPLLSFLALIFVFINLGVGCTHCLYNGAVGFSHMTGKSMRFLTIVLGIVGIIAAVSGIWNAFQSWLELLGLIVPPIATIIIIDQLILRKNQSLGSEGWKPLPFVAWGMAALVALLVNFFAPQLSVVVFGIGSSAIFYYVGSLLIKPTISQSVNKENNVK